MLVDALTKTNKRQRKRELVADSKIRAFRAYPPDDRLRTRTLRKHDHDPRLDRGTSLIVILLLSLGLWAVIWTVIGSLSSAVFR